MTDETAETKTQKPAALHWGIARQLILFSVGIVCGAGIMLIAGFYWLRSHLIREYVSDVPFEEIVRTMPYRTTEKLPAWLVSREKCMLSSFSDGRRIAVMKMCNRPYAAEMVENNYKTSALLPCTFAVFERPDGRTGLVRVDNSIIGKILGNPVSNIFSEKILPEQNIVLDLFDFRDE